MLHAARPIRSWLILDVSQTIVSSVPLFQTMADHKIKFIAAYAGPVISVLLASVLYRPHVIYLVSLVCGFFLALFLIDSLDKRVLIDNAGTTKRSVRPVKYWT